MLGLEVKIKLPFVKTVISWVDCLKDWQKSYCPLKLDVIISILDTGSFRPIIQYIYYWPVHSKIGSTLLNGALPLSLNSHHLRKLLRIDIFSKYISDNGATYYGEWPPVSKRQFCNSMIHRSHQTLHLAFCCYCYFLDAKAYLQALTPLKSDVFLSLFTTAQPILSALSTITHAGHKLKTVQYHNIVWNFTQALTWQSSDACKIQWWWIRREGGMVSSIDGDQK